MGIVMFDTVTVKTVPSFANTARDAVAGYIDGWYNDFAELKHDFPKAHHLTIAVHSQDDGDVLDIENGDASNGDAPGWFKKQRGRGSKLIVFYTSASNVQALINTLTSHGINRHEYKIWSAHYNGRQHICSPRVCGYPLADGTQWTETALGRNLDESYLADNFFGPVQPPKPKDPYHYEWFIDTKMRMSNGQQLIERNIVKLYDETRKRPLRYPLAIRHLKSDCRLLAHHIQSDAYEHLDKEHKPNWKIYRRRWRYDQLMERANGKQVVK